MLYWKYNCQVGGASHARNVKCTIVHTRSLTIFNFESWYFWQTSLFST